MVRKKEKKAPLYALNSAERRQQFRKDGKQHLQLGKCQCNNFDSQIGAITLAMMQYMMLLLYRQMHYGNSLGSIFDMLSSQAEEIMRIISAALEKKRAA